MDIGFIGLGAMGRQMAASLQHAGHALRVFDLNPKAAEPLLAGGAKLTKSPAAAADSAELVFTSVPGPADVEMLAAELFEAMKKGSAWFDLTTNSPEVVRRLHAKLAPRGIALLDAPVSGGPKGAESRKLAIWVGGDAAVYARYESVLKAIGEDALYVGPIGAGTVAKLAHNCASFGIQTVLAEAFSLGVKGGVEPLALFRAIRQGATGRKRPFDRMAEQYLPGKFDPPAFSLRLAHKDLKLAMEMGRANGVPMRMSELVMQDFEAAMARGWAERDARVSMVLQEERAGVSPRVDAAELQKILT
ncbi:MAG: NAD(P)-dependent oxidoreductase [Betaproteobacteria bacterium]|nr:NAD(P)-dependent oxidoreductase [Betaproteobacteria bacterium]